MLLAPCAGSHIADIALHLAVGNLAQLRYADIMFQV